LNKPRPSQNQFLFMKRIQTQIIVGLSAAAFVLSGASATAGTDIYFHDPTNVFISPGVSFFTTLRVSATDKTVGAFSVVLNYETNALQIQQVLGVSGSVFGTNVFADASSFQSGATRIVGFQTSGAGPSSQGQPVCYIVWGTVGNSDRQVQITSTVEKHISPTWQTEQIWSLPASVMINTNSSGPPQELRIGTMGFVGTDITLAFPTALTKRYQVECCDDLAWPVWTDVGDVIVGTGNVESVLDLGGAAHPVRFYRVRILK